MSSSPLGPARGERTTQSSDEPPVDCGASRADGSRKAFWSPPAGAFPACRAHAGVGGSTVFPASPADELEKPVGAGVVIVVAVVSWMVASGMLPLVLPKGAVAPFFWASERGPRPGPLQKAPPGPEIDLPVMFET